MIGRILSASLLTAATTLLGAAPAHASAESFCGELGGGWDGVVDTSKPEVVDQNTGPHFARIVPPASSDGSARP